MAGGEKRNIKSMRSLSAAIFVMTYIFTRPGGGAWLPGPSRSATDIYTF